MMKKLIEDFQKIATTITELTKISDLTAEHDILSNAERHIEITGYDNWDGGSDIHTVYLQIPIELYSKYESNLDKIEKTINSKFQPILRNYPNEYINDVVITPRLVQAKASVQTEYTQQEKHAFISYQTADKHVAGKIKQLLEGIGIEGFLAHEDIDVSLEWQDEILKNMAKSSLFICLLSSNYLNSFWCIQESGMARFKNSTVIPLTLDGTVPPGFISKYQAVRIDPERPRIHDLIPGLMKYNKFDVLEIIIEVIGSSRSFRGAESNFELILPYLNDLTEKQAKSLLEKIRQNNQVHHASLCANEYIPKVLKKYGNLISEDDLEFLKDRCKEYNGDV